MARICLLATLCALFAAAWSNDRTHQERFLTSARSHLSAGRIAYEPLARH